MIKQKQIGRDKKEICKILNFDRRTPNYILLEETKMRKLRMQEIKRVIKYKEKAKQRKNY